MTTFNPYHSGGVTKTVVTPNFSSYNASNTYANFTPASSVNSYGQQPQGGSQYSVPMGSRGNGGGGGTGGGGDNRYHRGGRGGGGYRNNNRQYNRMAPRDEVSKYYCETCCCDCLGKDSWTAHVKGQQHLKKLKLAASQKAAAAASSGTSSGSAMTSTGSAAVSVAGASSFAQNFCEICNCHCTNPDAFAAHIRGQKHQKAIKLHMKMGKTIPESLQPQVVKVIPKTNFTTGGTLITGQVNFLCFIIQASFFIDDAPNFCSTKSGPMRGISAPLSQG